MKTIPITPSLVQGAVSFEKGEGWLKPWRLRFEEKILFPPDDALMHIAERVSGVRLRFRTDSPEVALEVEPMDQKRVFDLTHDNEVIATVILPAGETSVPFDGLGTEERTYELWMPANAPVELSAVFVDEDASFSEVPEERPRWITYGSSITHAGSMPSPTQTWPAVTARRLNLHLTSLGFAGNCHLDPMVARMIRDMPADIITLKLGINVQGSSALNQRTWQPAVIGLVKIIREKHPSTPIGVITSICSPPRENGANQVGMSLEDYRVGTREAVRRLKENGDERLWLFEGFEMLGPAEAHLMPDELHPNAEGQALMGNRAAEKFLPVLLGAAGIA